MASFSFSSILPHVFVLLVLHLTLSSYHLAAKHGSHASPHHRHQSHQYHVSNPRLYKAYIALQAWKRVIYSDPNNFTTNWSGPSVCNYTGVYCAPALDDPKIRVVAGIDLNHANIAGFLPDELGLLTDLALLHLNGNRFCGILPQTFVNLPLLFELDLSNNRFVGPFPSVVLSMPSLYYLDIRYNEFEGPLPPELFKKSLDAVFVNNNHFTSSIPVSVGRTSASVLVLANNNFSGCLPPSISNSADTLEELLLINISLSGCLPLEVGFLYKLRVLDVSLNNIEGPIPYSIAGLAHLEQLNLGHNMMMGLVPTGVCILPSLVNFTFSYNFFCEEEGICQNLTSRGITYDESHNCLPEKPFQRSKKQCQAALEHPVDCFKHPCGSSSIRGAFGYSSMAAFAPASVPANAPLPPSPSVSPSP